MGSGVTQDFFSVCRAHHSRSSRNELAAAQTVFGALCLILPSNAVSDYAVDAQFFVGGVLDAYEDGFVEDAFRGTQNDKMYFDHFRRWNQGPL